MPSDLPLGSARLAGGGAPPKRSRRERTRRVRRLAVTWTVVAFAGVWGVIFGQMRAGDDPVLGAGKATAVTTTAGTSTTAAAVTDTAGRTTAEADTTSPVTTSQS